jgi:hypothetical protein
MSFSFFPLIDIGVCTDDIGKSRKTHFDLNKNRLRDQSDRNDLHPLIHF